MKLFSGVSIAAVLMAGVAMPSFATSFPTSTPFLNDQSISSASSLGTFVTLATTGVMAYSFGAGGTADQGTFDESVGYWSGSPFGATDLTYIVSVNVTAGDIQHISLTDFDAAANLAIYQTANGGTIAAGDFDWTNSLGNVEFDFSPPGNVNPGEQSYTEIVATNDPFYTTGSVGLIEGGGTTLVGFQPAAPATPEPSTLSLLGTGLLAAGAGLRRRMIRK